MKMEIVANDTLLTGALEDIQRDVDAGFDSFLPVPQDQRARLVEAMRYAAIGGGKRLRPLLVTATASLFKVPRATALRAGIAVEAIHVYSLIHDDLPCMDDDALRHGKPTLHKAFDEATAVLAGDSLHALAFEILASPNMTGDPFTRAELVNAPGEEGEGPLARGADEHNRISRAELVAALAGASGHEGMAGGQMMDMVAEQEGEAFDLHAITRLQQLKTGALLGASVELGAILGRVPPEGRAHLHGYARDIGLAFQIADDLLDLEGDEEKAGKALRKDEEAGKATFLSLLGPDRARDQAQMLVDQAISHLNAYGEEADLLRAIARYIVERDR